MSVTAEALLEQFKELPSEDQQEVLQQLLRLAASKRGASLKPLPTVKVAGGIITAEQVAEALENE